ncbi:MAG: T9SS type A sorting domain-containing protein [Bacteroidota bacterium]
MRNTPILFVFILIILTKSSVWGQKNVPLTEYNTLVELYNNSAGSGWTNNTNWLDTTNSTVDDWFGVTVENGHVTKVELPNNNLQEVIFENQVNLPELRVLDLFNNILDGADFSNLESCTKLDTFKVENNKLIFKHLLPVFELSGYDSISTFSYYPQAIIDERENVSVDEHSNFEFSISDQYVSYNDQIQWFMIYYDVSMWRLIALEGETNSSIEFSPVTMDDSGIYFVEITNPGVPGLTLRSNEKTLDVNPANDIGIPYSEYNALISFYNSLNGENWKNNENWLDTINHSVNDWYGITVRDGHVTDISLQNNNLLGNIPAEIGNLSLLKNLYLNHNNINGTIPTTMEQLNHLQVLSLSNNGIEGPIPLEMGNMTSLSYLDLERNNIGYFPNGSPRAEWQIPEELNNLPLLKSLLLAYNYLQYNDFERIFHWPNFSNISNFTYKYQNPGIDNITKEAAPGDRVTISLQNYFSAPSDQYQWVKNNDPIPDANDSVLILKNVQPLDEARYYCIITNTSVPDMEMTNYSTYLKVKNVHGAGIPLLEYKALEAFYFATNGDNWNYNTNWLDTINFSVKDWPGVIVRDGHVRKLWLDSNNVVGTIPLEILNLSYLEDLSLVKNKLSGNIPNQIGNLSKLIILSLSENNLTGNIPVSIGQISNLYYLGLTRNNLEGIIPTEIGNCTKIEGISLGYNNLSGSIPSSIGNLSKLRHLNLQYNSLSGTIPKSFGNLLELRTLNLNNNQLAGPIPVELNNLTKLYRFDINNNLIGTNSNEKSVHIIRESNRQIPDELAQLIDMDTFRLGNNSLQFNDIEAIFSWENFNDFNDFIYSPQDLIGSAKTIEKEEGESITLSIDNYYPGNSDKYIWYKNGVPVTNGTSKILTKENLKPEDAGNYSCIITNTVATELALTSCDITLNIQKKVASSGVPLAEYNALVEFYNLFDGSSWPKNDNWLDTLTSSVNNWAGVTVENGRVTAIDLSDLGLIGEVLDIFTAFDSLTWLNLANNNLYGNFPTFSASKSGNIESVVSNGHNLTYLNISNNNFVFSDIEPVADELLAIDTFIYWPQQTIGEPIDTSIYKYDTITLEIPGYVPGANDLYSWLINEQPLTGATDETYIIKNAMLQDSGLYYCSVTNTLFPELTLQSEIMKLNVLIPSGIGVFDLNQVELFPNPAYDKIYINIGNYKVNLKIYNLAGTLVLQKYKFRSEWLNIDEFAKGVYIFRIESENSGIINKKIIIK